MATYFPPKRATAYIIYIALESVATAGTFQSNPTIASGDFKVSLDGGSLANLTTLPTVTPASGKMVKISLSSAEMTADIVTIVCSDAAGNEWKDLVISLATVSNQEDDLAATLATIAAYIDTEVAAIKAKTDNLPSDPADASDIAASFGTITSTLTTIVSYIDTEVAAIKAKTDNLPSDPSSASTIATSFSAITTTLSTIASYIDTEVAAIKAKTDNLPGDPADASDIAAALAAISGYIDTEVATLITNVATIMGQTSTTGVALSTATKQAIADAVNARGMSHVDGAADKYSIYHLIMSLLNGKQAAGSWIPYTTTGTSIPGMAVPVDTDIDALPVVGTHGA